MKSLSIGLTEPQLEHLREIKKKYGISMAGFVRVLLKTDMERPLTEYAIVEERSEIVATKTRRRVAIHRGPVSPARADLMRELKTVIEKRKQKMEQAIVVSPVRA